MHLIKSLVCLLATLLQRCYLSSSFIFEVTGKVYPNGYFYVTMNIGNPQKPYFLDIDTGSSLTWVQCRLPCKVNILPAPNPPYEPTEDTEDMVCSDPRCASVQGPTAHRCHPSRSHQCFYDVEYVNHISSHGLMIIDSFSLQYMNGTVTNPRIAFGCGYKQQYNFANAPPFVDGILGLALGPEGILSQLKDHGVIRNVVGHCFSSKGDGYLFFGDEHVPTDVVWTPMISPTDTYLTKHYFVGTAELYLGGLSTRVSGLQVVFDSGSTYSYLIPAAYDTLVYMLIDDMKHKYVFTAESYTHRLQVCWKDSKPFDSIEDVRDFFKPIVFSFENSRNSWLQLDPEQYLIITESGNACLGIFNNEDKNLGNINIIGDISFHDKIIVYDNENRMIGWSSVRADCNNH